MRGEEREPAESGWSLKASLKEGTLKLRATSASGLIRSTEDLGGRPGSPGTRSHGELWEEPAVTAVARRMSVTMREVLNHLSITYLEIDIFTIINAL